MIDRLLIMIHGSLGVSRIRHDPCCVELGVEPPRTRPFRGSEALRAGELTRGELFGPRFRRVGYDTYAAPGFFPVTALGRIDAALTAVGPSAVATGWSACVVLGLDVTPGPRPVEVAVGGHRQPRSRAGVLVRCAHIDEDDVTVEDELRTTSPLRTAFDLAARCRDRPGPGATGLADTVAAVDALGRLGAFGRAELEAFAARHPGARGVRRVATVAELVDPRSDSPPESRLRVNLASTELPPPVVQHVVLRATRGRTFLLDLAWPAFGVAVEYDGRDHALSDRRGRDIDRLDELRRMGWIVIVVTAIQAARPRWVADRVREALVGRGWAG